VTTPRSGRPDSGAVASIPMVAEPDVDRSASLGNLVKEASTQVSTLVRAEIELAKLEVTKSVREGAIGGSFFAAAAATALFALFFFWFMVGEILATFLPRWLAFTIVVVLMLLIAALLAFLGLRKVKKVKKPERTIASLNDTAQALKSAATHQSDGQVGLNQPR
jgi:uncharacterized membrane protein YqjE